MDLVKPNDPHTKTYLAGIDDCHLTFCQACQVVELNLGALTLRLNPQSLQNLGMLLNQATRQLERLQVLKVQAEPGQVIRNERAH